MIVTREEIIKMYLYVLGHGRRDKLFVIEQRGDTGIACNLYIKGYSEDSFTDITEYKAW